MKQPVFVLATTANLILSGAALVVASLALNRPARVDNAQVRAAVDANLAQHEREAVEKLTPNFRKIYKDMLGEDAKIDWPPEGPKTLMELAQPMIKVIEGMQEAK